MKPITAFYLTECPYCRKAKEAIKELIQENPAYGDVQIDWYEESENPEAVKGHEYYYVPSMFIGTEKLYEAQTGQSYDEIKARVQLVLDKSLSM
jgi:glutaredoxin